MVLAFTSSPQNVLSPLAKRGLRPCGPCQSQLALGRGDVAKVDEKEPEVEADGLRGGKAAGERAESGEGRGRLLLVVEADRLGRERLGVVRCGARGGGELPLGGDRAER